MLASHPAASAGTRAGHQLTYASLHTLVTGWLIGSMALALGAFVAALTGRRSVAGVLMAMGWMLTLALFIANWRGAGGHAVHDP